MAETQFSRSTGSGAVSHTLNVVDYPWEIISVDILLDAGGAASDLTGTRVDAAGVVYNAILVAQAMEGLTVFEETFWPPKKMAPGDSFTLAYANGGGATFGSRIVYKLSDRES